MNEQAKAKPWYKFPFVWLIIFFPASAVIGGIHFIYIAFNEPNDVVKDDYYKEGLAINVRFAQDELARELNIKAVVSIVEERLLVRFDGPALPFIKFNLYHVRDSDQDINGALALTTKGEGTHHYAYQFNEVPYGRWYLELTGDDGKSTQTWRLKERLDLPISGELTILPAQN